MVRYRGPPPAGSKFTNSKSSEMILKNVKLSIDQLPLHLIYIFFSSFFLPSRFHIPSLKESLHQRVTYC